MLLKAESVEALRGTTREWREAGDTIGFVPTMGNLHKGHANLVQAARRRCDRVIVSVFVNPTQFGDGEDYHSYPRTLDLDTLLLRRAKADLLFLPELSEVYPFGQRGATRIHVPELTEELCGEYRPGHFDGVATVVSRFFFMIQPDFAVFGQKDYQQLLVIRRLVSDLSIPIEILAVPTAREKDGLAMSSRNQYLTQSERSIAPHLYRTLRETADCLAAGSRAFDELEQTCRDKLADAGFVPEYVGIRDAYSLARPSERSTDLVVLSAARLGKARLIDNVLVRIDD